MRVQKIAKQSLSYRIAKYERQKGERSQVSSGKRFKRGKVCHKKTGDQFPALQGLQTPHELVVAMGKDGDHFMRLLDSFRA